MADAEPLIRELPVVVALLHGVHGNEISSGEAAMALAYHLLAVQQDETVDLIRRESIVLIDPHTHINALQPASTTLADILGYHY